MRRIGLLAGIALAFGALWHADGAIADD